MRSGNGWHESACSREITIEAADGQKLASVIIGRTSATMTFDPLGGTYVRVPGDARAWLVRGNVALPPSALDWIERQVVHVPGPDIKALQIFEGGQMVLNVEKEIDEGQVQRYQLVPRDEKMQAVDSAVKQVQSGIVSLNFEDVLPAAAIKFPDGARRMTFTTFDGMTLTVDTTEQDGKMWARFAASAAPNADGAARAQQIAAATQGWVFQIPAYKLTAFNRPIVELTEAKGAPDQFMRGGPGGAMPPLPGLGR